MNTSELRFSRDTVPSKGCSLSCRIWGRSASERCDLVLVHGGAAHARWWDHLAPALARDRRVVALDLSGHGESEWRSSYSFEQWGGEILDIARYLDLKRPLVVGHSLGGVVALYAAALGAELISRVIVIDSALQTMGDPNERVGERARRASPLFPSRAVAVERFRLVPETVVSPELRQYIAQSSVRKVQGGWTWRFDRRTFSRKDSGTEQLASIVCPVTIVRAVRGFLTIEGATRCAEQIRGPVECVDLDSGHHVILEDPELVIDLIRARY